MERQQQPPEDLPSLEPSATESLLPKFSAELVASIRETLSKKSGQPSAQEASRETLGQCLREIVSHHANAEVTNLTVATDIVKALATAEFPTSPFYATIDRFSKDIAEILLADPVCHDQLLLLWKSLQTDPQ